MLRTYIRKSIKNYAIVTGGTGGVGKEIVSMFNNNKVPVILTGRNINKAECIAKELQELGNSTPIIAKELDLNNTESIINFCMDLKTTTTYPKYLINNAGVLILDKIHQIPEKHLNLMFNVNSIGPMLLTKYFLKEINNNHGFILFNSPPYNIDDKTSLIMPYMQSKLAQTTFMKSLANAYHHDWLTTCSFWTLYPLATDAIIKRGIGEEDDCMCPSILANIVEQIIWPSYPFSINGGELLDGKYLNAMGIDINKFKMSNKSPPLLDDLFYKHLTKNN